MDKEKEIEQMTEYLVQNGIFNNLVCRQDYAYPDAMIYECCRQTAELLINSGIGNVKQAIKEFAERLKEELWKFDGGWQEYDGEELCETVDTLITELYGADE